jgi:hypothetical protein
MSMPIDKRLNLEMNRRFPRCADFAVPATLAERSDQKLPCRDGLARGAVENCRVDSVIFLNLILT